MRGEPGSPSPTERLALLNSCHALRAGGEVARKLMGSTEQGASEATERGHAADK